jgi:molybdate transport system substrate-binding protein
VGAALLLVVLSACGGTGSGDTRQSAVAGDVNVFAAASLTEAFSAVGPAFQRHHAGLATHFNFAGTPVLLAQIQQGASADVLASADEASMQKAVAAGVVTGPTRVFAHNRLEIVVGRGNPRHVRGLSDLARPDLLYVTADPAVPVGRYTARALSAAGVRVSPRSQEPDVKSVLGKVELGEADAGVVYVTDVVAAGTRVTGVPIPDDQNVVATYPAARVAGSRNAENAARFLEFLQSAEGQAILGRFGFAAG